MIDVLAVPGPPMKSVLRCWPSERLRVNSLRTESIVEVLKKNEIQATLWDFLNFDHSTLISVAGYHAAEHSEDKPLDGVDHWATWVTHDTVAPRDARRTVQHNQ